MTAPRILLIEDEPAITDAMLYALRTEGFAPEWHSTGATGLAAASTRPPALVILDVGLPDANGFELCKALRAGSAIPVLFLTARNSEVDRIVGLEIGADDYVTKPFSPREVAARVKAILRRASAPALPVPGFGVPVVGESAPPMPAHGSASQVAPSGSAAPFPGAGPSETALTVGDFVHDADRCEVRFHGVVLQLTRMEYRLLCVLLARPGRVYSRDELMTQAWDDPGASLDRTVDAHVKTLRAKLKTVAPDAEPIQTHRGLGYSLRTSG